MRKGAPHVEILSLLLTKGKSNANAAEEGNDGLKKVVLLRIISYSYNLQLYIDEHEIIYLVLYTNMSAHITHTKIYAHMYVVIPKGGSNRQYRLLPIILLQRDLHSTLIQGEYLPHNLFTLLNLLPIYKIYGID